MWDVIVVGCGGVGSAALYHLACRGVRVLGLDQFAPPHDRGSSWGHTRIIRQAYFEHPDYVPLVLRAYDRWDELAALRGERLLRRLGVLQVGRPGGTVVRGVLASARLHGLAVKPLPAAAMRARFPMFCADEDYVGVYEPLAGCLLVEKCIAAHLAEAERRGAQREIGWPVRAWSVAGGQVRVVTDAHVHTAGRLVIAGGAWSGRLLHSLGLPLKVLRKIQYWYSPTDAAYAAESGCPAFLFETDAGVYYGLPDVDARGVKLAEHSGGLVVEDPTTISRDNDSAEQARVESFAGKHLPRLGRKLSAFHTCMYTMTPDEHFIVDVHPEHKPVVFAAGLSGHGFKFTPVLGEILADLTHHGTTELPCGFLKLNRPGLQAACEPGAPRGQSAATPTHPTS